MRFTYKNKKFIAGIVLISLALASLFVIHLKNDTGTNNNIAEQIMVNQSVEFEQRIPLIYDKAEYAENAVPIKSLLILGWNDTVILNVFVLFCLMNFQNKSYLLFKKRTTLVFLCVRMDE